MMLRRAAFAAALAAALAVSAVHWLGLLAGGVVVGLFARSWPRAIGGGAGFGVFAWVASVLVLADAGRLAGYLDAGQLLYVSVAIPVVLGAVGGLAYWLRGAGRTA
ncbi:MAG: hypothetical protein ABEH83_11910 [Halobacterium sp.]